MKEFLQFIVDNKEIISSGLISVICIVLAFFKKRPKAYSLNQYIEFIISKYLPGFINEAEKSGLIGEQKKAAVIKKCINVLGIMVQLDDIATDTAYKSFDTAIEYILSTPRKKI